jgi:uncharacterized protein YcbK (DUF882 family)
MGSLSKNFNADEFKCPCCSMMNVSIEFIEMLQKVRSIAQVPMRITSGCRCEFHNKSIRGVAHSAHCDGLAADISCLFGGQKFAIMAAAIDVGFNRIGVARSFIHLDIAKDKPQNVVWAY